MSDYRRWARQRAPIAEPEAAAIRVGIAAAPPAILLFESTTLDSLPLLMQLRAINETAAFNRFWGIEVESASEGNAVIAMPWREEGGQYSGFLHAGLVGALIDTACGFAAVTMVGRVLASHFSVNCLRPAVGERFVARARVVKPGKSQVFTACDLYARSGDEEKLVATGETLFTVVKADRTSPVPAAAS